MIENVQWIASSDCLPIAGASVQFKQRGDKPSSEGIVLPDGTIEPFNAKGIFIHKYYWAELPEERYMLPSLWKSDFRKSLQGISILCTTEEESKEVLIRAHALGWKWLEGQPYKDLSYWDTFTFTTCYNFYKGTYHSKSKALEDGQIVYPAEWFIELADSVIDKRSSLLGVVVNCKTREEAVQFTYYANNLGYKWIDGSSYLDNTQWDSYKENTWYCPEMGTFGSRADFARTYPELSLLSFKDFKAICEGVPEVKKLTKEDLKDTVIQCANLSELELCYGYAIGRELFTPGKLTSLNTLNMAYEYFGNQTCIDFTNNRCNKRSYFLKEGYRIRPAKWFLDNF